ncbi:MAG: rhomboid family intramembrane serine protease [Blastocatellia bacterium]
MCQVCRGLIEASASTCPLCGRDSIPPARISTAGLAAGGNFLSLVILTINIALFVLMSIVEVRSGRGADSFIQSASGGVLNDFGALVPSLVRDGQWWRLVTFNFLHIGLVHLMFNSSALFSIGPQVEETFGSQKFVFIYIGTGVASGIASYLFLPAGTAGASGAIFGLIGVMTVYGYRLGGSFGRALTRQMLIWAGIGIMFGFFIGANNVAHIGGFIAGGAIGFVLAPDAPVTVRASAVWNAAAIACIGVIAISFAMAGSVYGSQQEKMLEREVKRRQGQAVFELGSIVENAKNTIDQTSGLESEGSDALEDARAIAAELRRISGELEKSPAIDERSSAIKKRLIDLINNRASAFDAVKNDASFVAATSAGREPLDQAFSEFLQWQQDSIQRLLDAFEH